MDELSEDDKLTVARARKIQRFLSQPFQVAEVFTGSPGKLVPLQETIKGFKMILSGQWINAHFSKIFTHQNIHFIWFFVAGELDHLPEVAFYMVGPIEEAVEKAERLAEQQS